MSLVLIFDLDDTLYNERDFVESGFKAVAAYLEEVKGWPADKSFKHMMQTLDKEGRGRVFDNLLCSYGQLTVKAVAQCLTVYRNHSPNIRLYTAAFDLIKGLDVPLYIVTDGHKLVQQNKVQALGIESLFSKVFITHRYGVKNSKPSIYCFERIRSLEKCNWSQMVYVGDNPNKDFVNLTPLGVQTVRVLTGEYKDLLAKPGYEAMHIINSLSDLSDCLPDLCHKG
jgi:putative hydrolase of the HAD superfamily